MVYKSKRLAFIFGRLWEQVLLLWLLPQTCHPNEGRISSSNSTKLLVFVGTDYKSAIGCNDIETISKDSTLTVAFFTRDTVKKYGWDKIIVLKKYKTYTYDIKQLDSLNWVIEHKEK